MKKVGPSENVTLDIGSIVSVKTHPHTAATENIVIAAYNNMTPPYMIIAEVKKGGNYDKKTGERYHSYKCIFYSTESGKYEQYWFKDYELKSIKKTTKKGIHYINNELFENKSLTSLKKELVGKSAILKTADLELSKKQIFKDSDPEMDKYREKQFLDFLPPLCTIINVESQPDHLIYDEKTGNIDLEKSRFNVKLRWYNYKKSRYSEEFVPLNVLHLLDDNYEVIKYNPDEIYLLDKPLVLEENEEINLNKIPIKFHDLVFNHYFYIYRFRNLLTGELFDYHDVNETEPVKDKDKDGLLSLLQNGFRGIKESSKDYFKNNKDCEGKWFKIIYNDRRQEITTRIIYVNNLTTINGGIDDLNDEISFIEANCLLRNGNIRHFRIDRILAAEEVSTDIEKLLL